MLFNAPGQESTDNVQGCVETMLNSKVFAPFQQAKQMLGWINGKREAVTQKLVEDTKKRQNGATNKEKSDKNEEENSVNNEEESKQETQNASEDQTDESTSQK